MVVIALIHVLWLMLLPLGIYFCIRGFEKRVWWLAGIVLILISIPACCFLRYFWPFDFLFASRPRILERVQLKGWTVTLSQTPDVDFYHTDFIVVSPEGSTNTIVYDADDKKWWSAEALVGSNRVYFYRGGLWKDSSPSYLDLERRIFFSGYYLREEKLTESAAK